jgi:hypothetical protein
MATLTPATLDNLVIDNRNDGIFRVHRSAFTDPELLALEHRRVFEHTWIYVGHVSEVPQPGDFRTRNVAGRPLILVRGQAGVVRVLPNTCTHRGAQVCHEARGNSKTFQCFYHAWTLSSVVLRSLLCASILSMLQSRLPATRSAPGSRANILGSP